MTNKVTSDVTQRYLQILWKTLKTKFGKIHSVSMITMFVLQLTKGFTLFHIMFTTENINRIPVSRHFF